MSSTSLLAAAALAGLAGSPHCLAMCGAACAGVGGQKSRRAFAFQAGRLTGYAALGALAAASAGALQWAAAHAVLLKPLWGMFHVAVIALGASLLWLGAQPAWVERGAQQVWRSLRMRTLSLDTARWPFAAGVLWALLPCGLLYAALMLAALADSAVGGAAVMAVFALASGAVLQVGAILGQRLGTRSGAWGVRLAGAGLIAASAFALLHGLWPAFAAWCQ
ncbi:MAG: sulfite exporter TauE/SafE family protein [Burkholderiaceae bacterium]|nr:sulfite exporter TauE/SafE family protein [Burkholderiaceae bacterium]